MMSATKALERLREGNRAFVAGTASQNHRPDPSLTQQQAPFAIVVGCSDSRVPAEIVFDCGLGDLFVIRVVGNIVEPSQIGSVEFAAQMFGTRLVVVLGHSQCGAVKATLNGLAGRTADSPHLGMIVSRIAPVADQVRDGFDGDDEALCDAVVKANAIAMAQRLEEHSNILRRLALKEDLQIVAALYDLATGRVDFFDP